MASKPTQDRTQTRAFTTFEVVKGERIRVECPDYVDDSKIHLSENSRKVLERRYLRKDYDGTPLETPAGMFYRVAHFIAQGEEPFGGDVEATTRIFYDLLTELRFFPNSPTFTGAGTPLGQLAACFVLPIEDDMGKESPDGIFNTLRNAALIQQTGGGNGFSFSRLRPKGDVVRTSAGRATGPVGFLRVYDQAFGEIAQGGSRRGANMGVLRVDHPDIEEFITCKAEEGTIVNFNISVAITDEFMRAVQEDREFELRNPRDGSVWRTVRARDLFKKIVHYAHRNGEPGALFIDAANRTNPVPHLYELEATNPCVTGDTRIYTAEGIYTAEELFRSRQPLRVVVDGRLAPERTTCEATPVFCTGEKPVYLLETKEGYTLKATGDHRILTEQGWKALQDLEPGEKIYVLNRKGGFGKEGNLGIGRILGWFLGDGTLSMAHGAALLFFNGEQRLAPMFAEYLNEWIDPGEHSNSYAPTRNYPIGVQKIPARDETRIVSTRLRDKLQEIGITDRSRVPALVFRGTEEMQRGFLQGIFSADGTVLSNVEKGVSVRLWSHQLNLLRDVQQLLLNFGIASRIYTERKPEEERLMPDGQGGQALYHTSAGHELVISKRNLLTFYEEIGFLQPTKQEKLQQALQNYGARGPYQEKFTATVLSIKPLGVEPVYDLTEPITHSFVANGIVVHNCGEQWLGPYENCCLGSINLGVHVTTDAQGDTVVDWERLRRSVREATHFLDNVVTQNTYVPAVPQLREAAMRARRIGLGIMGLGDLMYKLRIRYGSEEGQEFAAQIMEFVRYHAMQRSIELARERGPFPAFPGSIYDPNQPGGMKWKPPRPLFPYTRDWGRPELDWDAIVDGISRYGLRNAAQTTVAPTGTIGTVSGCEGYGCEPVFALGYIRHFKDGDRDVELLYTSPLFQAALDTTDLSEERKQQIKEDVVTYGTCQHIDDLPEWIRHTFVVSQDITAEEHVRMQAAIQAFVDNSISKTINFPEDATEEDVAKAYQLAWELGCKGITVYVTGSRQEVVLETKAIREKKAGGDGAASPGANGKVHAPGQAHKAGTNGHQVELPEAFYVKRPRPHLLRGTTYRKDTPLGTAYITVNSDEHGDPFEVFVNIGKAGSDVSAVSEAIGRLISLVLRMPSALPPAERLRWVMDELAGIGGGRALGFGAQRVRSLPDGIAQVIAEYLKELPEEAQRPTPEAAEQLALPIAQRPIGDLCPECGEATFLNVEGCRKCAACGYSEC